jgi:hypothetical protein
MTETAELFMIDLAELKLETEECPFLLYSCPTCPECPKDIKRQKRDKK